MNLFEPEADSQIYLKMSKVLVIHPSDHLTWQPTLSATMLGGHVVTSSAFLEHDQSINQLFSRLKRMLNCTCQEISQENINVDMGVYFLFFLLQLVRVGRLIQMVAVRNLFLPMIFLRPTLQSPLLQMLLVCI